jgi:Spy/CpxP family protein refolding chaperone
MKPMFICGFLCTALLGFGCAGTPKPTDQLVRTEAALRAVEEVGVNNVPQAQLHQTLAREQVEKARKLMEEDENERARSALERAKADAELALALTREQQARTAAENAEASLNSGQQKPANPEMHVQSTTSN